METKTKTLHQDRWDEVTSNPVLQSLPYKVETNVRGQLILSPHQNIHSRLQKAIMRELDARLTQGESYPEYAIATEEGVKSPDVIWASDARMKEMNETGDPSTLAPEICVEVLSPANSEKEMQRKRHLYRAAGAEEVWVVGENGGVRYFAEKETDASALAPDFPKQLVHRQA